MSNDLPLSPIHYEPSLEHLEQDEAATTAALAEAMRGIADTTYKDSGKALRAVHAKSHGILRGELTVLPGLPEVLAHGIFAKEATFPVVMRLSTTPGDILDDSVSTPRGLAIKVSGVEGDRLPGSHGADTQDFLMINGPTFGAPDARHFLKVVKLLASTTDKAEGLKKVLSAVLRGTEKLVEAVGGQSTTLVALGGQPETHILGETFYTQVPLLYGPYVAKVSVAPASPELKALTNASLNVNGRPTGLRDAVVDFFRARGAQWEVRVQLCTDLTTMPIEDASVRWPQEQSPYLAVAHISVGPQDAWSETNITAVDAGMSFSPWNGIAAHRPLGSIMRVRKAVYELSAHQRAARGWRGDAGDGSSRITD